MGGPLRRIEQIEECTGAMRVESRWPSCGWFDRRVRRVSIRLECGHTAERRYADRPKGSRRIHCAECGRRKQLELFPGWIRESA